MNKPLTPERLAELETLCAQWQADRKVSRGGDDASKRVMQMLRAVPELIAALREIQGSLQGEHGNFATVRDLRGSWEYHFARANNAEHERDEQAALVKVLREALANLQHHHTRNHGWSYDCRWEQYELARKALALTSAEALGQEQERGA